MNKAIVEPLIRLKIFLLSLLGIEVFYCKKFEYQKNIKNYNLKINLMKLVLVHVQFLIASILYIFIDEKRNPFIPVSVAFESIFLVKVNYDYYLNKIEENQYFLNKKLYPFNQFSEEIK